MIRAACHCGAVRMEVVKAPECLLDCNCSICRRYGGLWAYYPPEEVKFLGTPGATFAYVWAHKQLEFHICRTCGCLTHWEAADKTYTERMGINGRMMLGLDPATVPVRQQDNGHTGIFWTKTDSPVIPSTHPKIKSPEPWR